MNDDYFIGTKEFEKDIWKNSMKIKIGKAEVLSLGWEEDVYKRQRKWSNCK